MLPTSAKLVYELSLELAHDFEQVSLAQTLTLDESRPLMGLRGTYGLFGSEKWWRNIANGLMPTKVISGVIERVYSSGQDADNEINTMDVISKEGEHLMEGIYLNFEKDLSLFKVGAEVYIFYALDPLKKQTSGGAVQFSEIVVEVAIS
ncbi:hypothetical protein [Undibacterium sp.]|uniref:hypothetical protein n=1 Tax=Undibacterium sp. TaxID=1914977 RepID=UPI00272F3059|nr:hypothetical protein [Undibacterium sp.]MDP1978671.1 hypothetical protein [Undibacterium sp.]